MELSCDTLDKIKDSVFELNIKYGEAQRLVRKTVRKLASESHRLFKRLLENAVKYAPDEDADRFFADIDEEAHRHIRNIRNISEVLIETLMPEPAVSGNAEGRKSKILWELAQIHREAAILAQHDKHIYWREIGDSQTLHAIPKNLDERLCDDIWSNGDCIKECVNGNNIHKKQSKKAREKKP